MTQRVRKSVGTFWKARVVDRSMLSTAFGNLVLVGIGSMVGCSYWFPPTAPPVVEWTMVHVSRGNQGDAHLIRYPDGEVHLIDVGDNNPQLARFLAAEGVDVVDKIILTHAHKDHYGGLEYLEHSPVRVRSLYSNAPPSKICEQETPWGCDWDHYHSTLNRFRVRGIPVREVKKGDVLYQTANTKLEVLFAHDALSAPVGQTDINDMSLILKLTHFHTTVLFTGDLNERLGRFLAQDSAIPLKADLLKVPHHGGIGIAPVEFFERVGAVAAFVPSPEWLWKTPRTERVRNYFGQNRIPLYVNGLHGDVRVRLNPTGHQILSTHPPASLPAPGTF